MRALHPWILGVGIALSGCSLSLQFECQDDSDCENLEGVFACSAGACVEMQPDMAPDMTPEPEEFACTDGQPLVSSGCIDLLGPLAGSPGASAAQREAEFMRRYEDYELIAIHVPAAGFQASGKPVIQAAVHFAINHINEAGGMTYGADGERKLLAALICDDASDNDDDVGVEAGAHAVSCGARAIVGTYSSTLTVAIFREVAQDANIPVISPGAISPQIPEARQTLGDDEGLLWRIKVPGAALIRGVVGLVDHLNYDSVHIIYRPGTQYDTAMREELDLVLGGGRATAHALVDDAGASNAAFIKDELTAAVQEDDRAVVISVVEDLADLLDVALGMIDASTESGLVADLISVEGGRSETAAGTIAFARTGVPNPVLPVICRAMGISSGAQNGPYDNWLNRFRAIAPNYGIDNLQLVAPVPAYVDAVFVTAYAMASGLRAGNGELTTPRLVDGLKLLSDRAIEGAERVEPLQWQKGIDALGADGSVPINYDGASGTIDLDPVTQDVTGRKIEIWQYLIGDATGLNELGDLVSDDAEDFNPNADAVESLLSPRARPSCEPFPYVGAP